MADNKKLAPNKVQYKSGNHAKVRTRTKLKYFMDVGGWDRGGGARAKTTFGIVSGHDIFLCSWLNESEGGTKLSNLIHGSSYLIEHNNQLYELSPALSSFVHFARSAHRGYLIDAIRTPELTPLTDPNQIILIFPDLHLNLFKGEPLDRFRWGYNYDTLMSLDWELRDLLMFANNDKYNVITVQVGDMYEIWEAEIILRQQYLALLKVAAKIDVLRHGWRVMVETGQVIPVISSHCNFLEAWEDAMKYGFKCNDETELAYGTELWVNDVKRHGVSIFDTEEIKAGIRRAHQKLFGGKETLFTYELAGNHDNNLSNRYWEKHRPDEYLDTFFLHRYSNVVRKDLLQSHRTLISSTKKGKNELRYVKLGKNNSIWIEHGHKYDWHNNDIDWYKPERGFDIVHMNVAGIINDIVKTRSSEYNADVARKWADRWTDFKDYEMRLPELQRADVIYNAEPSINLVILGHTHKPILQKAPLNTSFFETYPGHKTYITGEYCLQEERLIL